MKNELKALYKKDPKLAIEVAKVLGFKIKSIKLTPEEQALVNQSRGVKKSFISKYDATTKNLGKVIKIMNKNLEKLNKLVHKANSGSAGELESADDILNEVYNHILEANSVLTEWWK